MSAIAEPSCARLASRNARRRQRSLARQLGMVIAPITSAAAIARIDQGDRLAADRRAVREVLARYAAAWEARKPEEVLAINEVA